MKTVKAAKKRFKVTGRGKVKYQRAGKQHLLSSKTSKRRRNLRGRSTFESDHDTRDIRRCLLKEGK
jgi:large subunit ribosomal protein L35